MSSVKNGGFNVGMDNKLSKFSDLCDDIHESNRNCVFQSFGLGGIINRYNSRSYIFGL